MKLYNIWYALKASYVTMFVLLLASCDKNDEPEYYFPYEPEKPVNPDDSGNGNDPEIDGYIVGDLIYKLSTVNPDECYVNGVAKQGIVVNHISIPNEVTIEGKNYKVTEIGEKANISALSVVTSSNMEIIRNYAFTSDLQQLIVGANVKEVGQRAWNVYDGSTVTTNVGVILNDKVREKVSKIIWLPNTQPKGVIARLGGKVNYVSETYGSLNQGNVTKIPELTSLFWVDGILYALESPSERTCIGIGCDYSNSENVSLKPVVTNQGITFRVTKYGNYAFANNINIKHVLTGEMTQISEGTFMYCDNLYDINIGENIESIKKLAFYGCKQLQSLKIGPKVKKLGDDAITGCSGIEEFIVEASENENLMVGNYGSLFASDCSLKTVILYRNLKSSWSGSSNLDSFFESVKNLKTVKLLGYCTDVYNQEFKDCTSLTSVELGDNVKTIGNYAFSGCSAMESFIVGKSIDTINENAFSDCTGLTDFITEAVTPPYCGSQALQDIDKWKCKLHVPDESIDLYQKANQWKEFLFIE